MSEARVASGDRLLLALGPALAAGTDVGIRRANNEDGFHADLHGVLAVADGLGGLPAGEVASRVAIETVIAQLGDSQAVEQVTPIADRVAATFTVADRAIRREAHGDPSRRGMATTLVVAVVDGDSLFVAHVGDVRVYRLGSNGLERLTDDHTEAWQWVSAGIMSEAEAAHHPYRNSLTRVLGAGDCAEPSSREVHLDEEDVVLLCSDGLWDPVGAAAIESVLANRSVDAIERVSALLDLALAGGGPDNVTAVVYQHTP